MTFQPREPYPLPSHHATTPIPELLPGRRIHLRHPGYPEPANILLTLFANDHVSGEQGVHHDTARIACSILAGCSEKWEEGFFSETVHGPEISTLRDSVLTKSNYYFYKSKGDSSYGIVASFGDYRFRNVPDFWTSFPPIDEVDNNPRTGNLVSTILARDMSCRITNYKEATEVAHLIPRSEDTWFNLNSMSDYSSAARATIDDPANAILLRADVHWLFDNKRFAIVPKGSHWVVHVFEPGPSRELINLYHNVALQTLRGVPAAYIFARFAWTVFFYGQRFLEPMASRKVLIRNQDTGLYEAKSVTGQVFLEQQTQSKSRSRSPKKRSKQDTGEDDGDLYPYSDEEPRGRQKRRKGSEVSLTTTLYSRSEDRVAVDEGVEV